MDGDNMNLFKKQIILYIFLYGGIFCVGMGVAGELEMPLQVILIIIGGILLIAGAFLLSNK